MGGGALSDSPWLFNRSSICMRPGSHTQLPNNCPCPLLFCFFFESLEMSLFPSIVYSVCVFIKLHVTAQSSLVILVILVCVCVCFLPIHSGHQVRWTYQPGSHRRYFQRAQFMPIAGVGKRGEYQLVHGDLPRQHSFGTNLRFTGPVPADSRQ